MPQNTRPFWEKFKGHYWEITKRVLFEFGGPAALALIWMWHEWPAAPSSSQHAKDFGAAFFFLSWLWGQLLRVSYQKTQAKTLGAVRDDIGNVRGEIGEVKGIFVQMRNWLNTLQANTTNQPLIEQMATMLSTANTKIDSANTTLANTEHYTMQLETGFYKVTPGSV
jgi:hypothetical protein